MRRLSFIIYNLAYLKVSQAIHDMQYFFVQRRSSRFIVRLIYTNDSAYLPLMLLVYTLRSYLLFGNMGKITIMLIRCYIIGCRLPCSKHQSNPYQPIHEADLHSLSYRPESLLQNIFSKNSMKPGDCILLILEIPN